jgi:hypothetical protein
MFQRVAGALELPFARDAVSALVAEATGMCPGIPARRSGGLPASTDERVLDDADTLLVFARSLTEQEAHRWKSKRSSLLARRATCWFSGRTTMSASPQI